MNIEISEIEYRELLDILHIAVVIMSGHRREEDPRSSRHRALIQKLYALAKGAGLERLVRHNDSTHTYAPTEEYEDSSLSHVLINEFADHLFWDELISRLSVRDVAQNVGGIDRLNAMNENDRQAAEVSIRQKYIEEFSKNGVANLVVIERFDIRSGMPVKTSD
jgi:hypothetical protein